MSEEKNKEILKKGNIAIAEGNSDGMLSFCADNTERTFIGNRTLKGKEAVRQYMAMEYIEPPKFTVTNLIAEDNFVTAVGEITLKDKDGKEVLYAYCDIWRFSDGKIAELKASESSVSSKGVIFVNYKRDGEVKKSDIGA